MACKAAWFLLFLLNCQTTSATNKEGPSFFRPFPGNCPERTRHLSKFIELPHLCVSFEDHEVEHDDAVRSCASEGRGVRLITVGSLRKFLHVEFDYLTTDNRRVDGPFWVDARYHGSGEWRTTRSRREVEFDFFPEFDPHRAGEGELLVYHPDSKRLRAARPHERFRYICETEKRHVSRCHGHPQCLDRGDCHNRQCYCEYPFFGPICQYKGCIDECSQRQICNLKKGKCQCAPYFTDKACKVCSQSRLRGDGTQVCFLNGPSGVSYSSAQAYCQNHGMTLPQIYTSPIQQYVMEFINGSSWLGGNDLAQQGNYVWLPDKVPVQPYTNWLGGAPDTNMSRNCVKMDIAGLWQNVGCLAPKAYVCQISHTLLQGSAPSSCVAPMTDPCYQLITTSPLNFADARTQCQALNGDLAIIQNAAQNTVVKNLVAAANLATGAWIGLQRQGIDFYWVNGKILASYSNFDAGQPTNTTAQRCMTISQATGKWTVVDCSLTTFNTLCESPPFTS